MRVLLFPASVVIPTPEALEDTPGASQTVPSVPVEASVSSPPSRTRANIVAGAQLLKAAGKCALSDSDCGELLEIAEAIGSECAGNVARCVGQVAGGAAVGKALAAVKVLKRARKVTTAAEEAMARARALGSEGEILAGIQKSTRRIPSATGTAAFRIPDELGDGVLGEVKNVSRHSYTAQLKDFLLYARQNGLEFRLYVRTSTKLSCTLQRLVDAGDITLVRKLPG